MQDCALLHVRKQYLDLNEVEDFVNVLTYKHVRPCVKPANLSDDLGSLVQKYEKDDTGNIVVTHDCDFAVRDYVLKA